MYYKCIKDTNSKLTANLLLFKKDNVYMSEILYGQVRIRSEVYTRIPVLSSYRDSFIPISYLGRHHFWALKEKFL